jgi:hypothetical protein
VIPSTYVVAGHAFDDVVDAICPCGRAWSEIEDCTEADVGLPDRAHVGNLNMAELTQIRQEKARRAEKKERAWNAVCGIAGRST